jgi:hypothetical protein
MVLLLKRDLVSWLLAMDEHGRHQDLRGSSRQSVIPFIHGRTGLYCSSLPCLGIPFRSPLVKMCLPKNFIAQCWVVYNETRGPTGGPEVVKTLYNI